MAGAPSAWLYCGIALCAMARAGAQAPTQSPPPGFIEMPTSRAALAQLVDSAGRLIEEHREVAAARATLDAIIDGPAFERLYDNRQADALYWASVAAHDARDYERSFALMRRATERAPELPVNWIVRFHAAINVGETSDALASLVRLADNWPQMLPRVSPGAINQAITGARRLPSDDGEFRALSVLFKLRGYHQYLVEPSELWHRLSLLLLARGDAERALDVWGRVTDPAMLVRARADRRFDLLRAEEPDLFDVEAAAAREVERTREVAEFERTNLRAILAYTGALSDANRCQEALSVTERAIARTSGPNAEHNPFRDAYDYLSDLFEGRASFARCLGRWDDAVQQGVAAARLAEEGEPNVSQVINLAALYVALERPAEALAALELVGASSSFGKLLEQRIRFDAYLQLGDAEGMRGAMAFMAEHRNDAIATYQDALLASGDMAGAAAVLIHRLEDTGERADALYEVQDLAEGQLTALEQQRVALRKALLERTDVRDTIDRVGRIESYPLRR